jgi:hypothetical protein
VANNYPILSNTIFRSLPNIQRSTQSGGMLPVRVIDISLRDSNKGESLFQISNEWQGLGAIRFEPLNRSSIPQEFPQGNIAYPLDINFKKLPLIGEIVFVIPGPSVGRILDGNSDAIEFYYINSLTVWNSNHLNLLPSPSSYSSTTNNVNNTNVDKGIDNNEDTQVTEPIPGQTFKEKNDIRNLWPVEGDVIIEGRWGNSIRFSSTAKTPPGSTYQNPWSNSGNDGDPITIIRNGQSKVDLPVNNWVPIYEDISSDDSSIYMTTTQKLEFNLASNRFASFDIDNIPSANTTQIIQNVELENPNKSNKESDSTNIQSDSIESIPKKPTEGTETFLQGSSLPIVNGNTTLNANTGADSLKRRISRIQVEATFLKKFDGTYRGYLGGEGLQTINGESRNPEQLYADLAVQLRQANPGKELQFIEFKDIQIQG